jgi:hypothetical protein
MNEFFRDFNEIDISDFSVVLDARFRLNYANVVKYFIDFYCRRLENNATKIFSLILFIVKLISLTDYYVMSCSRLEISSFRRFFNVDVIFVEIIFYFEINKIFFYSFVLDHEIDKNSKHQIIV